MKSFLFLVALFGIGLLPVNASTVIDWVGSYRSENTPWKVAIHNDRPPVIEYDRKGGIDTAISPPAWRPRKGWFVFIESDYRLWAFDGTEILFLVQITEEGGTLYDLRSLPTVPPSAILHRLPEALRERISSQVNRR